MPHKKNPVRSERICGIARVVRGYVTPVMEGMPLWHERDISHLHRGADRAARRGGRHRLPARSRPPG